MESESAAPRQVIACVLVQAGQLLLLRRSTAVAWDAGLWHCVTGYAEDDNDLMGQALQEIAEEAGFDERQLRLRRAPRAVQIAGPSGTWPVQCCAFDVLDGAVALNWENDAAARVTRLDALPGPFVWWLPQVLDAVGWQLG